MSCRGLRDDAESRQTLRDAKIYIGPKSEIYDTFGKQLQNVLDVLEINNPTLDFKQALCPARISSIWSMETRQFVDGWKKLRALQENLSAISVV